MHVTMTWRGEGEWMHATMRGGEGEWMHATMRGGRVSGCMPL